MRLRKLARNVISLTFIMCSVVLGCQNSRQTAITEMRKELADRQTAIKQSMDLYEKSRQAIAKDDKEQARKLLEQAIEGYDRNAYAWMALGILEYDEGNLYESARAFHRACRLQPNRYEPYFNLGIVMETAGRYSRAIPEYEMALKLCPEQIEVMEHLARCYIKTKTKLTKARELIDQALAVECRTEWARWLDQQSQTLNSSPKEGQARSTGIGD